MWHFGTDESVLFREVSLIQGVLIERFHCNIIYLSNHAHSTSVPPSLSPLSSRCRGQLPHNQGEEEMGQDEVDGEPKYERKYFWTHYVNCQTNKQTNNMHMYIYTIILIRTYQPLPYLRCLHIIIAAYAHVHV